ncbi:adenosylcobinamide-GDP ribazoletransferase [Paenibacillus septentrionalis]|uniref:Adenosylcobinamide-GDP ribazoletransferase n=1 Tax=Paenibacillus septentrionalis TaxID=429342 RepID=A0ABW1UZD2_9BACL
MATVERDQVKEYGLACIAAFQFLTRIPIPIEVSFDKQTLQRSVLFFPVVGVVLGVIVSGMAALLAYVAPPSIAAVLTLALWVFLTGGLHLDGLMDTADGVLSGRSREQMLDIMKDSRVGAFGVLAACFVLLLKFAGLQYLFQQHIEQQLSITWLLLAIGAATTWSRWWMVISISSWKPARPSGLGELFNGVKLNHVSIATAISLFIYLMALMIYVSTTGGNLYYVWLSLLIPVCTAIVGWLIAKWLKRKLGGLTGDTYGAMNEIVEALNVTLVVVFIYTIL